MTQARKTNGFEHINIHSNPLILKEFSFKLYHKMSLFRINNLIIDSIDDDGLGKPMLSQIIGVV